MNLIRTTLIVGLMTLVFVLAPPPARAAWVECDSSAPGELRVGVILNQDQEAIDPSIETLVWRTVGPTERVFYEGPLLNFGATVRGLEPGTYSIVYEYNGPNGFDSRRFCSIEVDGEPASGATPRPSTAPTATPRPVTTGAPTAAPATIAPFPRPTASTTEPSTSLAATGVSATVDATPLADPVAAAVPADEQNALPPMTLLGLALIGLSLLLLIAALVRRRR